MGLGWGEFLAEGVAVVDVVALVDLGGFGADGVAGEVEFAGDAGEGEVGGDEEVLDALEREGGTGVVLGVVGAFAFLFEPGGFLDFAAEEEAAGGLEDEEVPGDAEVGAGEVQYAVAVGAGEDGGGCWEGFGEGGGEADPGAEVVAADGVVDDADGLAAAGAEPGPALEGVAALDEFVTGEAGEGLAEAFGHEVDVPAPLAGEDLIAAGLAKGLGVEVVGGIDEGDGVAVAAHEAGLEGGGERAGAAEGHEIIGAASEFAGDMVGRLARGTDAHGRDEGGDGFLGENDLVLAVEAGGIGGEGEARGDGEVAVGDAGVGGAEGEAGGAEGAEKMAVLPAVEAAAELGGVGKQARADGVEGVDEDVGEIVHGASFVAMPEAYGIC